MVIISFFFKNSCGGLSFFLRKSYFLGIDENLIYVKIIYNVGFFLRWIDKK